MTRLLALITIFLLVPAVAQAQDLGDLLEKNPEARVGPDRRRIDLRLSPAVRALAGEPELKSIGLSAGIDFNLVCGSGDLKAYVRSLVSKEAREGYLEGIIDAVIGEVLGSATELICQSSPTACSILQNNNLAANIKLTYNNDLCRTIEEAVLDGSKRGHAKNIQKCIDRKITEGKTEDEAIRACRNEEPEIYGFDGRIVKTLDLNSEIRRYLTFTGGGERVLGAVTDKTRVTSKGSSSDPDPNALPRIYDAHRTKYEDRWKSALERGGNSLSSNELEELLPPGSPRVTVEEIQLLARRPRSETRAFTQSVAAAAALLAMTRELNEVERKIEALAGSQAVKENEDNYRMLVSLLERLKSERQRLLRLFHDQERLNQALAAAHGLAMTELAEARLRAVKGAALGERRIRTLTGAQHFGSRGEKADNKLRSCGPKDGSSTKERIR